MSAKSYRLTVPALGVDIEADPEESLLENLLAAGVDYPHGCTSGVCGMCKSRLVSGSVEMEDYVSAISDSEIEAGLILPCCARASADCGVSPVDDGLLPPVRELMAEVASVTALTHDIVRLELALPPGERLTYLPGQYASLAIAGRPARDFSMASCPEDPTLVFYIRQVSAEGVTAFVQRGLRAGDPVRVKGPYGVAYLREGDLGPILGVAGGSGLAPLRAIVETALRRGMRQPIRLYFGVRTPGDLYESEALQALAARHPNLSVTTVFSQEAGAGARQGHLHEILEEDLAAQALADWRAYVAGPPVMVGRVEALLRRLGLPGDNCHTDPFLTQADQQRAATGTGG